MGEVRLQKIDDLTRSDHCHLDASDRIYYLREYTSHVGYKHSETNQLITNLKKLLDRRGQNDWKYKNQAIQRLAQELRAAMPRAPADATWVPVPPSKVKSDPLHDNRLQEVLNTAFPNEAILDLVVQVTSTIASHLADSRPRPDELVANYRIDPTLNPLSHRFIIFDDVLTTGCHFKAVQTILKGAYANAKCIGIFLARRIFPG